MGRYDLSEPEWRVVMPLLPPLGQGKQRVNDRVDPPRFGNTVFSCLPFGLFGDVS